MTKRTKAKAVTLFALLTLATSWFSVSSANAGNGITAVSAITGMPMKFKEKPVELNNSVFINNSVDKDGMLTSELTKVSSDGRYEVVEVLLGVPTLIAQTSDSGETGGLSIEKIRACLNARPQLYTLAKVRDNNASDGEGIKTVAIPVKFKGEHGTIQLNANGKPICPA
jgi:hypothetical protein